MHMSFTGERYVPELRGQIYYEHFHRYAMVLELARDKDVLDIACGEGYGTAALALVARTALGVDLDPESVRHAAARYMAMNVAFRAGDCAQIPASDGSFDLAVSFETIEHLMEQERMLSELKRVLRPNGLLVISSPNKLVYSDRRSFQNPFHQRELYFHEFRDLLRTFFPKVRIFGQRVFAASAVHPLRGAADETRWLGPSTVAEATLGALPDPEYFVAICACAEGDELPDLCSVYLDPRDELLADLRAGGLSPALNGGRTALEAPVQPGVLTSSVQPIDDEAELRLTTSQAELGKVERELTDRVNQVKSLEDHAVDLQSSLGAEQRRTSELVARVQDLTVELAQERENADRLEESGRREHEDLTARVADLESERDTAREIDVERRQERESLAARIAELEQDGYEAQERQVALERAIESLTVEREQLELAAKQQLAEDGAQKAALAERVAQAKSLEDHVTGVELLLSIEQERVAELVTTLHDLTAELAQERDALAQEHGALNRLETQRQDENRLLATRVAELTQERDAASRLEADRQSENQFLVARAAELESTVDRMQRMSAEMLDDRTRIERHAAGMMLERDSLRDALADQQRRHVGELRELEDKLLTERGQVDFELATARGENQQLRNRAAELAGIVAQQAAERDEVAAEMNRTRKGLDGAEEARRETERLTAQLNLERLNYDELAQQAHQAETVLAEVLGSTSWRVTLPARRFMAALRGRDKQ